MISGDITSKRRGEENKCQLVSPFAFRLHPPSWTVARARLRAHASLYTSCSHQQAHTRIRIFLICRRTAGGTAPHQNLIIIF